jgi:hypothetical protein
VYHCVILVITFANEVVILNDLFTGYVKAQQWLKPDTCT